MFSVVVTLFYKIILLVTGILSVKKFNLKKNKGMPSNKFRLKYIIILKLKMIMLTTHKIIVWNFTVPLNREKQGKSIPQKYKTTLRKFQQARWVFSALYPKLFKQICMETFFIFSFYGSCIMQAGLNGFKCKYIFIWIHTEKNIYKTFAKSVFLVFALERKFSISRIINLWLWIKWFLE